MMRLGARAFGRDEVETPQFECVRVGKYAARLHREEHPHTDVYHLSDSNGAEIIDLLKKDSRVVALADEGDFLVRNSICYVIWPKSKYHVSVQIINQDKFERFATYKLLEEILQ